MEATSDTISRFFKAYVTNPDGSIQQPPTRIKFTFGRDTLLDHSGIAALPHPLAQSSSKILEPALHNTVMDYLTNRTTVDWFNNLKLNLNSNWAQTSLLMASKFRKTNIMSIIEQQLVLYMRSTSHWPNWCHYYSNWLLSSRERHWNGSISRSYRYLESDQ